MVLVTVNLGFVLFAVGGLCWVTGRSNYWEDNGTAADNALSELVAGVVSLASTGAGSGTRDRGRHTWCSSWWWVVLGSWS